VLPLYTPGAAAQLLAVRESWLRRKAAARAVPCTFLGRHLRFSRADLEAIAQAAAHPPVPTPAAHPGHLLNPAPTLDAVEADDDLHGVGVERRSSRRGSVQRPSRRRGPNKASRHLRQATAGEIENGRGWAA
jgi:excisionase family DNA binding protein